MAKYRKKPVEVEAFLLGIDYIPDWFMDKVTQKQVTLFGEYRDLAGAKIHTLEGTMNAEKGDWIIKGVAGEIYPCRPDIFDKTYELAE